MNGAPAGHRYPVRARHERFAGSVFGVVTDEVAMPDGSYADRDYVEHIGAVAVVALDERDRVTLVRQYRHPVRAYLWELPAGLADVAGEEPVQTAVRELAEEARLRADRWHRLAGVHTSPGYSTEYLNVFLARGLSPAEDADFHPSGEELDMAVSQVDLDKAVDMVLSGEITNASSAVGILAAGYARRLDWTNLGHAIEVTK